MEIERVLATPFCPVGGAAGCGCGAGEFRRARAAGAAQIPFHAIALERLELLGVLAGEADGG